MKIESLRRLRGPNVYLSRPATVARLDLGELAGRETCDVTGFTERLLRALPGLAEHHCAAGSPGGFVSRLRNGTYFGHVTEHVCIELSQRIGRDVSFGRTVSTVLLSSSAASSSSPPPPHAAAVIASAATTGTSFMTLRISASCSCDDGRGDRAPTPPTGR